MQAGLRLKRNDVKSVNLANIEKVLCSWTSESKSEDTFSRPTFYALQHQFSDGYSEVPNRHDISMFFCKEKG